MRKIEKLEELKKIQLDILMSLHGFCMSHNIQYSLAAGTLIGAVRHKGFIPWDDDIDVYMLREEYNKLITLFPKEYEGKYSLLCLETDNNWYRSFGKLVDVRTVEIEKTRNKYKGMGIGIDIFPIDDVPDDDEQWKKYDKKRRFIRDMFTIKTLCYSNKRGLVKNMVIFMGRILLMPFPFSYLSKLMDRYSKKNNGQGYAHVYENSWGVYNSKRPWLKKDLKEVIDAEFEGKIVKIMKGYDDYLTTVYGDYMQLPPEEKRVSHHAFTAYWK